MTDTATAQELVSTHDTRKGETMTFKAIKIKRSEWTEKGQRGYFRDASTWCLLISDGRVIDGFATRKQAVAKGRQIVD